MGDDQNFLIPQYPFDYPQWYNTNGRVQVAASIPGQTQLNIVYLGQSLAANSSDSVYTPASTSVLNLNLFDGGVYQYKDPCFAASVGISAQSTPWRGGGTAGRLGQKIITGGLAQRVVMVTGAIDSTSIQNWFPYGDLTPNDCSHRIRVAAQRLAQNGLKAHAVVWQIGETDSNSNPVSMTTAYWKSIMEGVIAYGRKVGLSCPVYVTQSSHPFMSSKANVRAAQLAVLTANGGTHHDVFSAGDMDTLIGVNRQGASTYPGANYAGMTEWAASTAYTAGSGPSAYTGASVVFYSNSCFVCATDHTSTASFDAAKFLQLSDYIHLTGTGSDAAATLIYNNLVASGRLLAS